MADIYCYSFVEDLPSAEVARKLAEERNASRGPRLLFLPGFPSLTRGSGKLEKKCPSFLNMAKGGQFTFSIADLDTRPCAGATIREWFSIPGEQPLTLPKEIIFRVAVREVESWIMADRSAWAEYIEIAEDNFSPSPDTLLDPKQYLLSVVRRKGRKKYHREMLPRGSAHIGPGYNDVMCDFIVCHWSPLRAATRSPSLDRAVRALQRI
jgi:hypothetical protein